MTPRSRAATLAAVCALAAAPARAALWTAEPSVELACGANDNYGLAFDRRNRVATMAVTGSLLGTRATEAGATSLDAKLVGLALRGDLHQNEWQDSVTLDHKFAGPLDSFEFSGATARDDTRQIPGGSVDLLTARGLQRSNQATGDWTRALSERLSVVTGLGYQRTRYSAGLAGAHDYRNASGSASLRWLADERSSVNASASHQDYRTLDGGVRSQTDSLTFGGSRAFSETQSASLSLGAYRSRTTVKQAVLVCSLSCQEGLAGVSVLLETGRSARWGLQYNAGYGGALTETTKLAVSAARQQDPSGAGATVRSDTLRASLDHAFSETLSSSLNWTLSRAAYLGVQSGPSSQLQGLGLLLAKNLSPRWTLRANADWRRSAESLSGAHADAHASSVAITLRYEWQRLEAHR